MPLFTKKPSKSVSPAPFENHNIKANNSTSSAQLIEKNNEVNVIPPQLVFHCQLAHGSPTGLITGFASVRELYQKISECYDFSADEVSYHGKDTIIFAVPK